MDVLEEVLLKLGDALVRVRDDDVGGALEAACRPLEHVDATLLEELAHLPKKGEGKPLEEDEEEGKRDDDDALDDDDDDDALLGRSLLLTFGTVAMTPIEPTKAKGDATMRSATTAIM